MRPLVRISLCLTAAVLSLWGCCGEEHHTGDAPHSRVWLRCVANGWQRSPDWEFECRGSGRYVLFDKDLSHDFIIDVKSSGRWDCLVLGANADDSVIVANRPYHLAPRWGRLVQCGYPVMHCDSIVLDGGSRRDAAVITLHVSQAPRAFTLLDEAPRGTPTSHHVRTGGALQVLAIGNSLTAYHHQDSMFNAIARQCGLDATWTSACDGGASLATHWSRGLSLGGDGRLSPQWLVCSRPWTHIVLQDFSLRPLYDPEGFALSVHRWVEYIRSRCPNRDAEILVMVNWPWACLWDDYAGVHRHIAHNTRAVASREGIGISPVGDAFEAMFEAGGAEAARALYDDERHPSTAASYMAACIHVALITGLPLDSVGWCPSALSGEEAQEMRILAARALRNVH